MSLYHLENGSLLFKEPHLLLVDFSGGEYEQASVLTLEHPGRDTPQSTW